MAEQDVNVYAIIGELQVRVIALQMALKEAHEHINQLEKAKEHGESE